MGTTDVLTRGPWGLTVASCKRIVVDDASSVCRRIVMGREVRERGVGQRTDRRGAWRTGITLGLAWALANAVVALGHTPTVGESVYGQNGTDTYKWGDGSGSFPGWFQTSFNAAANGDWTNQILQRPNLVLQREQCEQGELVELGRMQRDLGSVL